jgi:type VI secretion system protein ImpK
MRDEIASLVYPVLEHGLKLKERLARGERPTVAGEQAVLRSLLGKAPRSQPWAGESDPTRSVGTLDAGRFLGIRYFLACWLDEIFIDNTPWGQEWSNNKLELQMFGIQLAYHRFWQQAEMTEGVASGAEALEAGLLCAYFGFRGERGEDPERLREWVARARKRVGGATREPTFPERPFPTHVPPLTSEDRYRRMVRTLNWGVLALAPVAAIFLVWLLKSN